MGDCARRPLDQATFAFYTERAPHYTSSRGATHSSALNAFLDRLRPGVRLLELGCGGGQDWPG